MMLSKSRRIPASFFLKQNKECRLFFSPFFSIRVCKNNLTLNRAAVVVSKKIISSAVKRNRIRRILYNIICAKLKGIDGSVGKNFDFILYVKKIKSEISFNELEKEINKLLKTFL